MCSVPKVKDWIFLWWNDLTTTSFYYKWQTLELDVGEDGGVIWVTQEMGCSIFICVPFSVASHFKCSKTGKKYRDDCQQCRKTAQIIRTDCLMLVLVAFVEYICKEIISPNIEMRTSRCEFSSQLNHRN